ncbi:hypothetical protein, partial [Faecalibacterium sp. DFI.5.82]|uniref:hypothetical protein n=1 Tax=Faecalibacterium sp. DFI.5.82 TaxID=3031725 RepID=UPI0023AF1695
MTPSPSLRAQRSNPGRRAISGRGVSLGCFVALARTMGLRSALEASLGFERCAPRYLQGRVDLLA